VFVHNLYVSGSVEERVIALQNKKKWLSSSLLADEAAGSAITEGDIESLFAPLE
jgi:SNF2 family DNA or RNA helicase